MIRVTIEIFPVGSVRQGKIAGKALIVNDGTGAKTRGNYLVQIYGGNNKLLGTAKLKDFPRKRLGVWSLLKRCLNEISKY